MVSTPQPARKARRWPVLVGLALSGVLGVFVLWSREPGPQLEAVREPSEDEPAPAASAALLRALRDPSNGAPPAPSAADPDSQLTPPVSSAEAREWALQHTRRSLELYRETMVFPPWSRPYDGSTKHLAEWNRPWSVGQPFAADANRNEIRADVTLDKLYAAPGEALNAKLSVAYEETAEPVEPTSVTGRVELYETASESWKPAAEVEFTRTAPGNYTAAFTPSTIAALRAAPREPRFITRVTLGEFFKELPQTFQYAAEDVFVVTGMRSNRVVAGSLEIVLDVDVRHAVPTLVQAALFDAEGKNGIAVYDDYFRPESTGATQLTLRFFGKAIRGKGLRGPYSVRALHGHIKHPAAEPPEVFWARKDEPVLLTRAYDSSEFSENEWASPEKDAKIAQYGKMMDEL